MRYEYDANGRQTAAKLLDNTSVQDSVYDCAGQRVHTTAGGVTRTMVYDIFGQNVADYTGSAGTTLERENIYRGGQLLATYTPTTPSALSTTSSGSSVTLHWTAVSGATNYRVERKAAGLGQILTLSYVGHSVHASSVEILKLLFPASSTQGRL